MCSKCVKKHCKPAIYRPFKILSSSVVTPFDATESKYQQNCEVVPVHCTMKTYGGVEVQFHLQDLTSLIMLLE
jgi:hypothetical protein